MIIYICLETFHNILMHLPFSSKKWREIIRAKIMYKQTNTIHSLVRTYGFMLLSMKNSFRALFHNSYAMVYYNYNKVTI